MSNQDNATVRAMGKDVEVLYALAESMKSFMHAKSINADFGKTAIMQPDKATVKGIVKEVADRAFRSDLSAIAENANGLGSNASINASVRKDLINKLRGEMVARGEHMLLDTQTSGGVLSNITTHQQMYLVALTQGVVSPSYNKIFKTVVDPAPVFVRQINYPEFIDHNGNAYPLADVVNNNKLILELTSASSPNLVFDIPVTAGKVDTNIIDAYQAASGSTRRIASPKNFLGRGFRLISMKYTSGGTDKDVPLNITSMENHSQSGEISNSVGIVNASLPAKAAGSPALDIYGRVLANGDVKLTVSDSNVKSIKIAFNLPPVGVQNPFKVRTRLAKFQESLKQVTQGQCTLNPSYIDDYSFYINKDAIEDFNTNVLVITNGAKDAYAFNQIDELIKELKADNDPLFRNTDNYFESPTRKLLVENKVDMNVFNPRFASSPDGNNLGLAQELFNSMNELVRFSHAQEAKFTLYSPSAAAQWLKDAHGQSLSKFNIIGQAGGDIAGLTTPYDVIRTTIGGIYETNYVATDRLDGKAKELVGPYGTIPTGKKATVKELEFTISPNFEETLDTTVMVLGKEYLTEGTGTDEDPASPSLNYRQRYDFLKMNKLIGRLIFTPMPSSYQD